MTGTLPDDELGNFQSEYRFQALPDAARGLSILALTAITVALLGPDWVVHDAPPVLALLALCSLGGYQLARGWWLYRSRIHLHTGGFVLLRGKRREIFDWLRVDAVHRAKPAGRRRSGWSGRLHRLARGPFARVCPERLGCRYTVRTKDGTRLALTRSLRGVDELGTIVEDAVSEALLPEAVAALRAGGSVPFGPLAVTARQLRHDTCSACWSCLAQPLLSSGTVHVARRDGTTFATVPADAVPNLPLLASLAEGLRSGT